MQTQKRIADQTPADGQPVTPEHPEWEVAAWRMPNGARHVVLKDDSEETWEAYCRMLAARSITREKVLSLSRLIA